MRCVVSHDAGGAEMLASYLARDGGEWATVLAGPAERIFRQRLSALNIMSLDEAIEQSDEVLTGSGWQSDLEWSAIARAKALGKRVVTYLDHWVNYRERFSRGGVEHLPDAIWVGDDYGLERARKVFPEIDVGFVANPYFEDIRDEMAQYVNTNRSRTSTEGLHVLFIAEPISEHAKKAHNNPRHWGYTEFDALRFLFSKLDQLGGDIVSLTIRPHPAELPGKYDKISTEIDIGARIGGTKPLIQEIMQADVVVGCASMAMIVGLLAGKRVVCAIPPGGQVCPLPHREIEHLALGTGFGE